MGSSYAKGAWTGLTVEAQILRNRAWRPSLLPSPRPAGQEWWAVPRPLRKCRVRTAGVLASVGLNGGGQRVVCCAWDGTELTRFPGGTYSSTRDLQGRPREICVRRNLGGVTPYPPPV